MSSIFRLQLEAYKLIVSGLELARSVQQPFEYTCRSFITIPGLNIKFEDFNLLRLDPSDILISKETNYKLPGILKRHSEDSQIEKFMINSNYRYEHSDLSNQSKSHLIKHYFYSSEASNLNHMIEINETLSNRSNRKIDASAKIQIKLFYSGLRGRLTDFKNRIFGEIAIGQVRIDKYRQIERNTNFAAQIVARNVPKPKKMLVSVHRQRSGRIYLNFNERPLIDTSLHFNQNINANRKQYNFQMKSTNFKSLDVSLIVTKNWISMPIVIQLPGLHQKQFGNSVQLHHPGILSNFYSNFANISPEIFMTGFKIEILPRYTPGKITVPLSIKNSYEKPLKEYHFQLDFTELHLIDVQPDNRLLLMITEKKRAIFAIEVNRFRQPGSVNVYGRLKTGLVLPNYDLEFSGQVHVIRKRRTFTSAVVSYLPKFEVKVKNAEYSDKSKKFIPYEVYSRLVSSIYFDIF